MILGNYLVINGKYIPNEDLAQNDKLRYTIFVRGSEYNKNYVRAKFLPK